MASRRKKRAVRPAPKRRPPPAPTSRRRQGERARAQAKILAVATRLFARKGIENVTIGEISGEARMSRPLVYFYYPDLRTLFLEAAHAAGRRLQERLHSAMSDTRSGQDAIVAMGQAYVSFHAEDPDGFSLCLADTGPESPEHTPTSSEQQILDLEREIMEMLLTAISRGSADGSIRNDIGDPRLLALHLWAFVQGLVHLSSSHAVTLERIYGIPPAHFLTGGFATLRIALAHPG